MLELQQAFLLNGMLHVFKVKNILRATSNFIVKDMERPLHTKEAAANTTTSAVFNSGEDYEEIKTLFRILLYEFP